MDEHRTPVIRRLRTTAGHLNAVISMIENNAPCHEVLHQLCAVQAALRATGCLLIDEQIQNSLAIIQNSNSPQERAQELECLLNLYQIMIK